MSVLVAGTTLGSYRIIEQIGLGGMATVYKAYQPSMERYVALKVLPQHYAHDPKFVQRFIREARIIAQLEHKNILPVYDFGEEAGITYLAMRYLEGGTLKDVLSAGSLSLRDAAEVLTQMCSALDYAHRKGVIHRDVKPANIIVDDEGSAYLTDFGIAKVLEETEGLTETGAAVGTPAYMSPEQVMGQTLDGRTDIYSLGIVLYEIAVGRTPFQSDTPMATALAHVHQPLPLPRQVNPDVPEAVERVIIKALAKNPADRYGTANQLAATLNKTVEMLGAASGDSTLRLLVAQAREQHAAITTPRAPALQAAPPVDKAPARRRLSPIALGSVGLVGLMVVCAAVVGVFGQSLFAPKAGAPAATGIVSSVASADAGSTSSAPTQPGAETTQIIATPGDPTLYDDFNNPAFDSSFNTDLWSESCASSDYVQGDGVLSINFGVQSNQVNCNLFSQKSYRVSIKDVGQLQARIKAAQGYQGNTTVEAIQFRAMDPLSGREAWASLCGLKTFPGSGAQALFKINRYTSPTSPGTAQVERVIAARTETWYTFRLAVDPASLKVECFVDDLLLGSAIPDSYYKPTAPDFQRELAGYADVGGSGTYTIDDVRFLPAPGEAAASPTP
jgi:serine/threonine protein kinase